jgi:hypothetical protein
LRISNNPISTIVSSTEVIDEENDKGTEINHGTNKRVPSRVYIRGREIENLAVRKYRECGRGTKYSDLMKEFHCSKAKAQRILKYSCNKSMMVMKGEHIVRQDPILFTLYQRTNPQTYFPRCLKADIIENLKKKGKMALPRDQMDNVSKKNVLRSFFEKSNEHYYQDENNGDPHELAKAEYFQDILKSLPFVCRGIHKIQLVTSIKKNYYNDLDRILPRAVNRAKIQHENIGNRIVTYTFSPNGAVEIAIACSNNPFRIEYEEDINLLFSFLGQVKDRLLYMVSDPHEREVPQINDWVLKSCDLNKDVEVTDKCQIVCPDLQLKYAGRVFRIYVKSLSDRAVARVEESLNVNLSMSHALESIAHPKVVDRWDSSTFSRASLEVFMLCTSYIRYNLIRCE